MKPHKNPLRGIKCACGRQSILISGTIPLCRKCNDKLSIRKRGKDGR